MFRSISIAASIRVGLAVMASISLFGGVNRVKAADNLIANPSVETGLYGYPDNWSREKVGNNVSVFGNRVAGEDGERAIQIAATSYVGGYSGWFFNPVNVDAGGAYQYSEYYKASVLTELYIRVKSKSGQLSTVSLKNVPAASDWKRLEVEFSVPADAQTATLIHRVAALGTLTTDHFSLSKQDGSAPSVDTTPPVVTIAAPPADATVSGELTLSAIATDNVGVVGVRFMIDGSQFGSEAASPEYNVVLNTMILADGLHTVAATARDVAGNTAMTAVRTFVVDNAPIPNPPVDTTPPVVTITAPVAGVTVSGALSLIADASDNTRIAGVQFMIDGTPFGTEILTPPYQRMLDTRSLSDGLHVVGATARDDAGNIAVAAALSISVDNEPVPVPPAGNIVPNPSVETVSPTNSNLPLSWKKVKTGNNNAAFTFLKTGNTGLRSLQVKITKYITGVAYYEFNAQPVVGGKTYEYSVRYKSDTYAETDAEITLTDGTVKYEYLGVVYPSPTGWSTFTTRLTLPENAKSIKIYSLLYSAGYLITDDYSVTPVVIVPFARPIVTLTFDDFFTSFYDNAYPLFKKYGMTGTMYLVSDDLDKPEMMTAAQLREIQTYGFEIGSHSVSHPHMPLLTSSELDAELGDSRAILSRYMGTDIVSFATPYGEYTDQVLSHIANFYTSHRSVDVGLNTRDWFNKYNIKAMSPTVATTPDTVLGWVDEAIANNAWLSIVYHDIVNGGPTFSNTPAHLEAVLSGLSARGVRVLTNKQALAEVLPQVP